MNRAKNPKQNLSIKKLAGTKNLTSNTVWYILGTTKQLAARIPDQVPQSKNWTTIMCNELGKITNRLQKHKGTQTIFLYHTKCHPKKEIPQTFHSV